MNLELEKSQPYSSREEFDLMEPTSHPHLYIWFSRSERDSFFLQMFYPDWKGAHRIKEMLKFLIQHNHKYEACLLYPVPRKQNPFIESPYILYPK